MNIAMSMISDVDSDHTSQSINRLLNCTRHAAEAMAKHAPWPEVRERQAMMLRDIVGNPFRSPPPVHHDWLTWENGLVPSLAQAAFEERALPNGELDPIRLAILADALEDAGCNEAELLDHLRGPELHVRGCWAVDAILLLAPH